MYEIVQPSANGRGDGREHDVTQQRVRGANGPPNTGVGGGVLDHRRLVEDMENSSAVLEAALVSPQSSPSARAERRELAALVADQLARLPNNYREVIVLRHLEGLTFPEVARRMGRSQDSVEKLWLRGLTRLRHAFGETP